MKPLTYSLRLILTLLLTGLLILLTCDSGPVIGAHAQIKPPEKKYQYFIRLDVDPQAFNRVNYVLDSIMNRWGVERTGTQIEQAKSMFTNHLSYLVGSAKLDSVEVKSEVKGGGK